MPYKALYGKDANLGHLRAIGARAFRVCENPHQDTGTPCLGWTPRRLQYVQQVFSDLQRIDKECTREQERHLDRDTFGFA